MGFKNLRAKKAKKNEAVVIVDGLSFTCRRISFASPEFLAMFKAFVTEYNLLDRFSDDKAERWMIHSLMGTYEDDVSFLGDFIVTGWAGFEDDNGKEVPFSPDAFKDCFLNYENEYEETGLKDIIAGLLATLNTSSVYSVSEEDLKNS